MKPAVGIHFSFSSLTKVVDVRALLARKTLSAALRSGSDGGAQIDVVCYQMRNPCRGEYWTRNHLSTKRGPDWRVSSLHQCKEVRCIGTPLRCGPPLHQGEASGEQEKRGGPYAGITANVRRGDSCHKLENRGRRETGMKVGRVLRGRRVKWASFQEHGRVWGDWRSSDRNRAWLGYRRRRANGGCVGPERA